MSNVYNDDVNAVAEDAFARAQQYHAAAITRWLADVVYEMADPAGGDGFPRAFRMTLRGLAQEMDAGRLQVPEAFR